MKRIGILFGGLLLAASLSFGAAGCTSKISEEQLAQIQDLKRKEAMLKDEIQKKKIDITQLRSEIHKRQSTVDDCQKRLEFVKSKLAQWPNVWPEVKPLVPRQEQ